ncbi:hypothetical protein [Amycolatopsis sp. NBC_00438]|uniref:hypothetical protein n=1 Tax=Amycolatopsis sp. NBC_00438 TaxID=2903558 RepID=UPI002E1A4F83
MGYDRLGVSRVGGALGTDLATALALLRGHARRTGRRLTDVARAVVTRAEDVRQLLGSEADRDRTAGLPAMRSAR